MIKQDIYESCLSAEWLSSYEKDIPDVILHQIHLLLYWAVPQPLLCHPLFPNESIAQFSYGRHQLISNHTITPDNVTLGIAFP